MTKRKKEDLIELEHLEQEAQESISETNTISLTLLGVFWGIILGVLTNFFVILLYDIYIESMNLNSKIILLFVLGAMSIIFVILILDRLAKLNQGLSKIKKLLKNLRDLKKNWQKEI